jgi:predicted O-methyltransferase YrrM
MDAEAYILNHSDAEPDYLAFINRKTHVKVLNPRMLSGHLQGRVLSALSKMIRPLTILELGTFTGYSALCLAEGLQPDGILHTIECDDELEDMIRENLALSPYNHQIQLHIGDALDIIRNLQESFDLVFIDADKREYSAYFHAVLPKVNKGGFILADNTLWDGKVLQEISLKDEQTVAIDGFNKEIAACDTVEKIILPLRDGLTIIRKK